MARASRMSVQKLKRERDKREKAERKRELRDQRVATGENTGGQQATRDDLEGYGFGPPAEEEKGED